MVDLEQRLSAAADAIEWPTVDLTARVRNRIASQPNRKTRPRWVQIAVVALLAIVVLAAGTPWGRRAVADLLGVAGIQVGWGKPALPAGAGLDLGEMVSLTEGAARMTFDPLLPGDPPDAVYHGDLPVGGALHMVWRSGDPLPAAENSDVGILYSQFQVTESELFVKSLDPTAQVVRVTVRGQPGFWIEGAHHYLLYRDTAGVIHEDGGRFAGNVLAWEEEGVTHRIETGSSLEDTLQLAESLTD